MIDSWIVGGDWLDWFPLHMQTLTFPLVTLSTFTEQSLENVSFSCNRHKWRSSWNALSERRGIGICYTTLLLNYCK